VDRLQVLSTFLRKSIFEPQPSLARDQLLAVPLDEFKPLWSQIVAPVRSFFNFDYVTSNFRSLIESLFGTASQPIAALGAPSFGTMPRVTPRSASRSIAPNYFSWTIRNVLVAAGRSRTLVELTYDGFRRLVEPYKIDYHVRKSDAIGSEYFWGYDRSGGRSGSVTIKTFLCDKIQSARPTNMSFVPRYQIEL
jgi:hypothetical protein